MKKVIYIFILLLLGGKAFSQTSLGGSENDVPQEYTIGGIKFQGGDNYDYNALQVISGLSVGDKIKIPGDKIAKAIQNLWDQQLFSGVKIYQEKVVGSNIFLIIELQERPRMSKFQIIGVKKGTADDIRKKINLVSGKVVTKDIIVDTKNTIKNYFYDKGYPNAKVTIREVKDTTLANSEILIINIDRNHRIKIKNINISGNKVLRAGQIRRAMKKTKRNRPWSILTISKFQPAEFEKDKQKIIDKYNDKGYRDAKIVSDSVYKNPDGKSLNIDLKVSEGQRYYFGNISFVGNTKYTDDQLAKVLGIKKGDVYNQELFNTRLTMNPKGSDISSLYLNDGYLFFNVTPIETRVHNDSIDFEIRIYEGKQARINKILITGNDKTNEHVIRRELTTLPGQLFSRADIIRSQRALASLGYFDPEKIQIVPKPHPENGTVDIEYKVVEKPSDQIQVSGGWGGGAGFVGTLRLLFTNFSIKNFFKKNTWRPLPSGDGEHLSLAFQSNGTYYQSYNLSFTEPWLGGHKPNSLTVAFYRSLETNGIKKYTKDSEGNKILNTSRQSIDISGASVGLGKRLKFPDNYFTLYSELSYQYYVLNNYSTSFIFSNGYANDVSLKFVLGRNSTNQQIYPSTGTNTDFTLEVTPPYSAFRSPNTDYADMDANKRYNLIEYHKWKFITDWYESLNKTHKLVLHTKVGFGFLGLYNRNLGLAPFERFYMGGSGLTNFSLDGREIIPMRGYDDGVLSPTYGAAIATKYSLELRYPFSLNPAATIYGLAFFDAGNTWASFKSFNPFDIKRAAGVGIRVYMSAFGLLGLDWGYRLDDIPGVTTSNSKHSQISFTIGKALNGW